MAAYAALLSLNFTIDQHHYRSVVYPPQYPIQSSVKQTITFLLRVFQDYNYQMIQQQVVELEREIAEASYDVDYVIECLVLDPVLVKSGCNRKHSSKLFSEDEMIQIVNKFVSLREKAMKIIDVKVTCDDQLPSGGPSRSVNSSGVVYDKMVGFNDYQKRVLNLICYGEKKLMILPIFGEGGVGKTTLTRSVFDHEETKKKFEITMWSTISQSPDLQSVLSSFLEDLGIVNDGQTSPGEQLHKRLSGKRYLIVLDDIWGVDVWDTIKSFFPDNYNKSRIIITTRISTVASYIGFGYRYLLRSLSEDQSWDLLSRKVFPQGDCPPELEEFGRQINKSCRGLPLVIVVIAGHLSKTKMTRDSWENVAKCLGSAGDSKDEDWCLQFLSFCYENLPVYLKPCFLYMGIFPEDHSIELSLLVKLWLAEGFLKPKGAKCLEDVAIEYLTDLVSRNLILVTERSSSGKIKYLKIHDFLRDLCLNKAHEYNFLRSRTYLSLGMIPGAERDYPLYLLPMRERYMEVSTSELASKLDFCDTKNVVRFRLRCIRLSAAQVMDISICSSYLASIYMFKNLHTLVMRRIPGHEPVILPLQIWEMPLLKHVEIQRVVLPSPPDAQSHVEDKVHYVLKDMQTLLNVYNFKFSDKVCKIIPNLKKLKISYTGVSDQFVEKPCDYLDNLVHLCNLESLNCSMYGKISAAHIAFPLALKSLTLGGGMIPWEGMGMVGSLPNLEKLSLWNDAFFGSGWKTIEGQFCKLKALHLGCLSLEYLNTRSTHFPVLERLTFYDMQRLKRVPQGIGEIETLRLVSLEYCLKSLADSAHSLKELNVLLFGEESLRVHVSSSSLSYIPLSEGPETQLEATTQLKILLTKKSPRMRDVIRAGVIPRLAQFLRRHDLPPQLRFEVILATTIVTSGTSNHMGVVIKHGAVPLFVQLLSSSSDDVCKQAVWALGHFTGAPMPLLTQLYDYSKLSMLRISTRTLAIFCSGKFPPPFVQLRLALPVLGQLIHWNDEEVLTNACRALAYLSNGTKDRTRLVIKAGMSPRLVKLLLHPSPTVLEPALQTMGNIVTVDDVQKQCVIDNHVLPRLHQLLTQNHDKSITWEACRMIANITAGNRAQIHSVIEADIILPLVQLIQDAEFDIKKQAVRAILNATTGGSDEQIRLLVNQGCIKPLRDLLICPDPIMRTLCIKGLTNILKVGEADN